MNCASAGPGVADLNVPAGQPDATHAVLGAAEAALFARFGRTHRMAAGAHLFRRGDIGTQMYVVISGTVDLDFGEDLVIKHMGPGEFFGELGLLIGDHPRSADAIAASD